jgi:dipeptidyl aminopeptidase/acylaminoacyl peptidase
MSRKPNPPGRLAVEVGSVEGGQRTRLVESGTGGVAARGRLYFVRETTLLAQAFDSRTLTVTGDPVPVAEGVWRNMDTDGLTAFSVAEDGTLAYRGGGLLQGQLTWLDRQGRPLGTVGPPGILVSMDLSPDDDRVLAEIVDPVRDTSALFVLDGATGMTTRVSFGTGNQTDGLYSPDGRQIAFSWDAQGPFDLFRREVGSAAEPTALLSSGVWKYPESWSPDGRYLSYNQSEPGQPRDIWVLPMTGDAKPFPIAQTPAEESGSAFSPDGRFLAYVSDESGRSEVFVRTFPASTRKWQVSTGGGTAPVWRRDGKELFYLTPDLTLTAVPTALSASGLDPGPARALFQSQGWHLPSGPGRSPYAAAADGQRFLAVVNVGEAESSPIVLETGARP